MEEESIDIEISDYSEELVGSETLHSINITEAATHSEPKVKKTEDKLVKLPFSRVKTLIKLDPDVNLANQESVFLISKATEFFIERLAKEACSHTLASKKRTIQKQDVLKCVDTVEALSFLDGIIE